VVTHQLQVERGTWKVRRSKTGVLPLCHAAEWLHYPWKCRLTSQIVVTWGRPSYKFSRSSRRYLCVQGWLRDVRYTRNKWLTQVHTASYVFPICSTKRWHGGWPWVTVIITIYGRRMQGHYILLLYFSFLFRQQRWKTSHGISIKLGL